MKIVLLGGAGLMGRATARDLVEHEPDLELVLADLDEAAAERIAGGLGQAVAGARGRISTCRVDASDERAVGAAIRGADVVINSALYYFNMPVMRAALREGVAYLDLGGLFHVTREQLALGPAFAKADLTAVLGMGSTPGITNVQARHAAAGMERVDSIRIFNGNTPNPDSPSAWGYSINTILDEATKRPIVFREGQLSEVEPLADPEPFAFLDPIGVQQVHHSLHSELATLPGAFAAKGVREVTFKLNHFGFTPRAMRELKTLADAGFASSDPLEVADRSRAGSSASVRPRDVLVAVLVREGERCSAAARARGEDPDAFVVDYEEVVVELRGEREGDRVTVRVDTIAEGRPDWRLSGGTLLTATPPAVVACWLGEGSLRMPGVHAPEAVVEPARLFAALEKRGMPTRTEVRPGW